MRLRSTLPLLILSLAFSVGPRAAQPIAPYPTAPLCPTHDTRAWHGLWNAVDGCHYDHQHGDDPKAVNDLFGTSLFDLMGGEVSHPWQTFSAAGYENDLKHAGYFWHVRRDLPPAPGQVGPWIRAFRLLVHQHPTGRDAAVRFHSGVFEALMSDGGRIQIPGMWVDFGHLLVDGVRVIDEGLTAEPGRHKQHGSSGAPQIIWYGASEATHTPDAQGRIPRGFATISTSVHDVWDHTSASNPSSTTDYACYPNPACRANATLLRAHLIGVQVHPSLRALVDPDGNGVADWSGYTDRYGVPVAGCAAPSLDCVPVTMSGISTLVDSYSCGDAVCGAQYRDYDIYFSGRTSGWSQPVP